MKKHGGKIHSQLGDLDTDEKKLAAPPHSTDVWARMRKATAVQKVKKGGGLGEGEVLFARNGNYLGKGVPRKTDLTRKEWSSRRVLRGGRDWKGEIGDE